MFASGIKVGQRPESHEKIMGNNQQPWLPIEAIEFLESSLDKNHIGFEFGSGSSSFWFSGLTKEIYSIESDREWYKMMVDLSASHNVKNINFDCIECDMLPIWDNDTEYGENYDLYGKKIKEYEFNFDYIFIDGVARSLCILNSIDKLNIGGYLIIDNAERPAYKKSLDLIPENWECIKFECSVDTTLVYRKIKD